jgi:hypothetical protein
MEIELDLSKSIEDNAAKYFEDAKEAKTRIAGLKKAIAIGAIKQKERDLQAIEKAKSKILLKQEDTRIRIKYKLHDIAIDIIDTFYKSNQHSFKCFHNIIKYIGGISICLMNLCY